MTMNRREFLEGSAALLAASIELESTASRVRETPSAPVAAAIAG